MDSDAFLTGGSYAPMPGGPGREMHPPGKGRFHAGGDEAQPLVGGEPENILGGESFKWDLVSDLDHFFARLYHYYCNKGFWCIVTQWVVELLTLGFTITFSGFLILFVNWPWLLQAKCGIQAAEAGHEPCDLVREGLVRHPLAPMTFWKAMAVVYLAMFSAFWAFCFARFFLQLRELLEVREFCHARLGVGEKELQTMSWPDLVERIVRFQSRHRLCIVKELSAHDIVSRIMRKENYTIGMLNKNVLALEMPRCVPGAAPLPGFAGGRKPRRRKNRTKRHLVLTKTLEWSLNWCILHHMFDANFAIRRDFVREPERLKRRLRMVGVGMALVSPFLVVFMLMYFFMRNAEQFYHQPGTVGSRRWSNLAKWRLREFNELDHLFQRRLNASYQHAVAYVKQFPSPIVSMVAKFVSFVTGACAAVLLGVALVDESLLEAQLFERNLFWYAAIFGTILAVSRSLITEEFTVFDPEAVMQYTARYTHYMPKHWRGKANTDPVRGEFEALFQFKFVLFFEEMASIFITPFLLWFYVPKCVDNILRFVHDFTTQVEGVGDVCSLSAFDFAHHGNSKYGSPCDAAKDRRSTQGKMEKSFLSFVSNYPTWEPPPNGQKMLGMLSTFRTRNEAASSAFPLTSSALRNSAPYYPPRAAMSHHFSGSYRGVASRHGGEGAGGGFGHRLPMPSGGDHPDPAIDSHLGASGVLATTGANPEEATQLYWLDRYYEAARATGSGIELDPLSKDGGGSAQAETGVSTDGAQARPNAQEFGDDVTRDGRFEGADRPMETRVMISDGRGGGSVGAARGSDGRVMTSDGRVMTSDGRVMTSDGRVMTSDGRVMGTDGRMMNSDGRASVSDRRIAGFDGRAMSSDARGFASDGRAMSTDARARRGPMSESEMDRVLVDQALQRNAVRGRGVDFGVASVMEEPEEEDDDFLQPDLLQPHPFGLNSGQRSAHNDTWPSFGSMQREGAGRADPTGVASIRFGSGHASGRSGGSSRGPWGIVSGQESAFGIEEGAPSRATGPFARLHDDSGASSVFSERRPRGRSWAGSGSLRGSGSQGGFGRTREWSRGSWDEEVEGSFAQRGFGVSNEQSNSPGQSGLWDNDGEATGVGGGGQSGESKGRPERRSFS